MSQDLQVLFVEDSPDDAELVLREMKRGDLQVRPLRVETEEDFVRAMDEGTWDVVISDYHLPRFTGLRALELFRQRTYDIPFIMVSGSIGEDLAVEAMRAGANDYILKSNLKRLNEAVRREVRYSRLRLRDRSRIREKDAVHRALLDGLPDLIVRIDRDEVVLDYVPGTHLELGLPAHEVPGRRLRDVLLPGLYEKVRPHVATAFGGQRVDTEYAAELRGETRFHELRAGLADPGSILLIVRDVTDRRRTEVELREKEDMLQRSQRMEVLGRLAGGVAHDFNNLLTAIRGFTAYAREEVPQGSQAWDDLGEVLEAASRAAALTRQLLAFARRQVIEPISLDLRDSVFNSEKLLRRLLGEDIELRIDARTDGARVMADPNQMDQVVMNLAVNARDAMPSGGTLTIRVEPVHVEVPESVGSGEIPAGDYVALTVSDTGTGIPEEIRAQVFEPFFTTKGQSVGTGLGLSTCYGIVKQSGGFITFESEIGKGTTFRVLLPRTEEVTTGVSSRPVVTARGAETILVAEDEAPVRSLVCRALRSLGYRVLAGRDGAEALELCEKHPSEIHLLVTDVVMPRMGGPELALAARRLRPDLRVLFLTGYTGGAGSRLDELAPDAALLRKPFGREDLSMAVRRILDEAAVPEDAGAAGDAGADQDRTGSGSSLTSTQ